MENYIGTKIGSLYIYKVINNEVICYCSNCKCSNIKFKESDFKNLMSKGNNVTCGCELEELKQENDIIKLGTTFKKLTVIKKLGNCQYECRCLCGKLEIISKENLQNGQKTMCELCQKIDNEIKKSNVILRNNRIRKELYYIWVSYKQLYENPVPKFKKQIIDKDIKFFPELKDDFKRFCQWAILNGYQKNGKVFLDRKNKDEDFSVSNCFWSSNKTNSFVKIPTRNINTEIVWEEKTDIIEEYLQTNQGNLCKEDMEIAKIEKQTSVKQDKQMLLKYFQKRYNIEKISFQVNDLITHLNSGVKTNNMIVPIKLEYKELLQMLKNYETIFAKNHKKFKPNFNEDNNKMLYYDLVTLINDLDNYEERLRAEELESVRLELEAQQKFYEEYGIDMEE